MKIGIIGNIQKTNLPALLNDFFQWLDAQQIEFILETELATFLGPLAQGRKQKPTVELSRFCDLILTFGGDGTLLGAARLVADTPVPILGINMGRLGFLAEISPDELIPSIEEILQNKHQIVQRSLLEARLENAPDSDPIIGLNDIVFKSSGISRMIHVEVSIDDEFLNTYRCDGLIIASPTGSTAYSLSASGPIIDPDVQSIIINPICPHALNARPVVISDKKTVRVLVQPDHEEIYFCGDGQMVHPLPPATPVIIRKAPYTLSWIRCQHKNFYGILRAKLGW